jgi:hypothetical protein
MLEEIFGGLDAQQRDIFFGSALSAA